MRRKQLHSFVAACAVALAAAAALLAWGAAPRLAAADSTGDVERIRVHLATVEAELLSADVSRLTAVQRAARARHIAVLREYREAGVFPHNHTIPDRYVPVFVDEHGTHCAVGHLLARDGRHDLVERVRSMRNTVTVPQLADDPDLVAWLAQAGLTLEEAARIQPWYGPLDPDVEATDRSYRNVTLAATALGAGASAWNLLADDASGRGLRGALGLGAGAGSIALGTIGLIDRAGESASDGDGVEPGYIALNFGIGAVSAALGLRTLLRGDAETPRRTGAGPAAPQRVQWQLSPWTQPAHGGAGLRLDVRF